MVNTVSQDLDSWIIRDVFQIRIYFKLKNCYFFLKKAFIVSRFNLYQLDQLTIIMQKKFITHIYLC